MTKKEIINRNIGLTFDLLRQITEDSSIIDKIHNKSTIEFVEKDFARIEKTTIKPKSKRKYMRVKSQLHPIA